MLLNITISEFDWAILSFAIAELIVFIKFIVSLHTKSKLMETELLGLKEQFKMQSEQFEELKTLIENTSSKINDYFEKGNKSRDELRESLFKELKSIDDKFDQYDRDTQRRIDTVGQAVRVVETKFETLKK